jgi:hypothetical protein
VPQTYYFCINNALKLTYDHLYCKKKIFYARYRSPCREGTIGQRKGGEGRGEEREGKGRGGNGMEGKGRGEDRKEGKGEGKVKGLQPPKFGTLSSPLAYVQS